MLFGGSFAILTSLLGLASVRWKKVYFICPFGCLAVSTGVLLLVAGGLLAEFGAASAEFYDRVCVSNKAATDEVRRLYTKNIDAHMCSTNCPCWSGHMMYEPKAEEEPTPLTSSANRATATEFIPFTYRNRALWTGYMGVDEQTLRRFGRTR